MAQALELMRLFSKRSLPGIKRIGKNQQRLIISAARYVSRIRQLHVLSHRLMSHPDMESIARALFEAASEVPEVKAITLRLRNEATGVFEPIACHNLDKDEWRMAAPLGGVGLSRAAIKTRQAVTLVDLHSYPNIQNASFLKKYGLASYLGIPLLSPSGVNGVIGCYSGSARGFEQEDIEFLTLVVDLTAFALGIATYSPRALQGGEKSAISRTPSGHSEQAKEEFLNVMSHEFRTPLSLIMGHTGMMREGLLGEINDEQRNSLDRIMENSDSLLAMVLSILQVSRIEAGGIHLIARAIVVHELFAELKANYAPQVNERRKIVWYCSPDLPELTSDRERLKDILRHLIDNAVKFTAHGRIVISAEQVQEPAGIRFTVADTG
ncbi:MAG: histidine kinase dimerization/phospho-acceptor domain-containing protein, partial [Candidatus Binatia bacterium]